jgi:hypothetical protein
MNRPFIGVAAAIAAIATPAVLAITAAASTAAPSSFELVFEGRHEPQSFWHVGEFTASGAFCSSGSVRSLGVTGTSPADTEATRVLTCADGSGSATARVVSIEHEHGGAGEWRIVSGIGRHEKLRGQGTFRSIRAGGDPSDHASITFRSTWTGIADQDDTPPAIAIARASVTKLRRPPSSYVLRIAFSAHDAPGNAVRYHIAVKGKGAFLASRLGETRSGRTWAAIRVRAPKGVRTLSVEIIASDPLGNASRLSRDVALRR